MILSHLKITRSIMNLEKKDQIMMKKKVIRVTLIIGKLLILREMKT
jgi:hypothetical protein